MAKARDLLGINSRSSEYLRLNSHRARRTADSKWLSKRFFIKKKIPTPKLLGMLANTREIEDFDWSSLGVGFVVKPVEGLGGEGILVIKKPAKAVGSYVMMDGSKIDVGDLKFHCRDIVQGRFSRNNLPDSALIEERVKIHPKFLKIAVGGTPDVRVIVFNRVPVMAMLRVPTAESNGKSNLHQGAIGLGVDMATGITTYGVYRGKQIKFFPGTRDKVNGITVPFWSKVLETAVKIQFKLPSLGYFGCDILIDQEKGPVVIELNDQPGLNIQLANMAGLRRRLERVEGLEIDSVEKGVKVSRALFAAKFAQRVMGALAGDKQVIGVFETVKVKPDKGKRVEVLAKIDTGAYSTSIDEDLATELGLLKPEHVLWEKRFKSALGVEMRKVVEINFKMRGIKVKARASVTKRGGLRRKMIIGRRDLKQFMLDPALVKVRK
ncbi:hypothetical protein A2368_01390 [Candidatus Collierbacteria bacterium RIFOXYB1_FULL_49_13]|uniref:ATP-grasp domain-containing protein n=1 Tax=Candidatus Collierbacteria bacterium RIFOXYB1_FULL_49_13 TaxID=1817728 RepID=A0A1F5FGQ4_9BACT|nr:MAG: hypothetical protein A2368_01390 [Candidatus Collierbacteria bacterium RIFOXYB1_FULL_49_13]